MDWLKYGLCMEDNYNGQLLRTSQWLIKNVEDIKMVSETLRWHCNDVVIQMVCYVKETLVRRGLS